MFIQIDDKYALTSDSNQWKVQIKREPHPSSIVKSEWVTLSFHHTFKSATESLARRKVRLSGAQNLINACEFDYLEGNIVKYVTRYKHKNGVVDLRKAEFYLRMLIERELNGIGDET